METAITEAFIKSVQQSIDKCMAEVKEESRKFAAALNAVKHLAPVGVGVGVATATPLPTTPQLPTATPVDSSHLEHRLSALELAYQRQVQKTIAGLSEDIGDLDGRLSRLEQNQVPIDDQCASWTFQNTDSGWPGPSKTNEIILGSSVVVDDRSTVVDFGLGDVVVNVNHLSQDQDIEMTTTQTPVSTTVSPTVSPVVQKEEQEEVEEVEEAEEESLELDEFEFEGETYYKDPDNNVYKPNEDGEVDSEAPIGRWLEKKQTIKLY